MSFDFPPDLDAAERSIYIADNLCRASVTVAIALANATINLGRSITPVVMADVLNACLNEAGDLTSEPAVYAPGAPVLSAGSLVDVEADTTNFGLVVEMLLQITNLTGSEVLSMGKSVSTDAALGPNESAASAIDMETIQQAGSDLVYTPSTGTVTTTAGGVFVVRCHYSATYNT
jgi:hypothetical protein